MDVVKKRDFIHSHLHEVGEDIINELYSRIRSKVGRDNPIIGYKSNGTPIYKDGFVNKIKESEEQIERGEYLTIDELTKESEQW